MGGLSRIDGILLRTLIISGNQSIQQGCHVVVRHFTDSYAIIEAERHAMAVPRHFIAIIPPDSPRVHKHKKKSNKRKKK